MEGEILGGKEREPNYQYDAVVVLCASYKLGRKDYEFPTIDKESKEKVFGGKMRLIAAAQLIKDGKTPLLILNGPKSLGHGELSNAQAQLKYLHQRMHVPLDSLIIAEEEGRNTLEQAQKLKTFLEDHELTGKKIAVLTSAFHLPRSMRMFRMTGLDLTFIPAEKILWGRSKHYRNLIRRLYESEEMDIRRSFERAGIKALLSGRYESGVI